MSRTLKLTAKESVTIRESTDELLEVEATYGPHGKPPPSHLHPAQDEHFEVLAGSVQVRLAGEERTLQAGGTIDIPRRVLHQMWNPSPDPARVLWQTRPRGRTEEWFTAIDRLHREGGAGRNGMPSPRAFAALLSEYRDVFRLGARPAWLVRGVLFLLARLGRSRAV